MTDRIKEGFLKENPEFKPQTVRITKANFQAYEDVRASGITNMWDVRTVMQLSGLSKAQCMEIMKRYGEFNTKWPDVRKS